MILTGTIASSAGGYDYIDVEGTTYEEARARLDSLLGEGQKLVVIRSDTY